MHINSTSWQDVLNWTWIFIKNRDLADNDGSKLCDRTAFQLWLNFKFQQWILVLHKQLKLLYIY